MANVRAQGLKALGVELEIEGATNECFYEAWDSVQSIKPPTVKGKCAANGRVDLDGQAKILISH